MKVQWGVITYKTVLTYTWTHTLVKTNTKKYKKTPHKLERKWFCYSLCKVMNDLDGLLIYTGVNHLFKEIYFLVSYLDVFILLLNDIDSRKILHRTSDYADVVLL